MSATPPLSTLSDAHLLVLAACNVVVGTGAMVVTGLLTRITADLQVSTAEAGQLLSTYAWPWQERRAKYLLCANLNGGISLANMAGACDLSVRQSTGMSAHEWLTQHRIEKAKSLLAGSSLRLAEIAAHCGFADQSHFTRAFGRVTGMLPTQCRRLHRSQALTVRLLLRHQSGANAVMYTGVDALR